MNVFSQNSTRATCQEPGKAIRPGNWVLAILFLSFLLSYGQEAEKDKEAEKTARASESLLYEANEELARDNFEDAEVNYRKAIAKNAENATAKYNLGNAYYRREDLGEAFTRYKQAGETASTKEEKHRAYHNLGNVFMKNKEYEKAVEAYKEALRNNPTDEETRYNLALAKEMLEKNPPEDNKNDQDNKDQDQDKQDQDKQDQDKGGEDNKDENQKDQDQGDKGDDGEQQPEDNKDQGNDEQGENEEGQDQEGQPEEGEGEPQPRQSQLSPQQIQALLDAMGKEEKRVQDKINAKKTKGAKVPSEKDW